MITIKDIIKWSRPHGMSKFTGGKGRHTLFGNKNIQISIVGGDSGLYGDFKDTFEIAIFDTQNGEFMTRFFCPEADDDVIPYMSAKRLEELVNSLFKKENISIEE
jgi:hypothetical protein